MPERASLWRSLDIQRRVIGALLMREIITRYGRHNIGFLWLFVEPMIFTTGVTLMWGALKSGQSVSSLPITAFAVTGYSSVMLWRNIVSKCNVGITPNLSLMYHRNVRVLDIFLSRIILEVSGTTTAFTILSLVFISISWMEPPADILKVLHGWALLAWFGSSLGMVTGALTERSELVEKLWHPVSYVLFPLSGAGFMVDWLPTSMREVVLWVPIVHAMELLREGYFGGTIRAHYDIGYMSFCCLCLMFLGLALVKDAGRRLEPQ
ncbi:MAG: ABC transporter permease [Candidatus Methylumidiphilus sp.]